MRGAGPISVKLSGFFVGESALLAKMNGEEADQLANPAWDDPIIRCVGHPRGVPSLRQGNNLTHMGAGPRPPELIRTWEKLSTGRM